MKVLLAHNRYQWLGGEDVAHRLDRRLLERHGHEIISYERDNAEIEGLGLVGRARVAAESVWSPRSRRDLAELVSRTEPDIAYFVNTFPLISPSALAACRDAGLPVVVGLHTYRLACPNAFLFRDGDVCEDCLHRRVKWPGVLHACYRESRVQTGVVATMLAVHDVARAWHRYVDVFVAVSEFGRDKLVESGLPHDRVLVRPNYTDPDPGGRAPGPDGGFALFVGRLSEEKGVGVLVDGFAKLPDIPLKIVGDGPARGGLEQAIATAGLTNVELVGPLAHAEVLELMRSARLFVFPALSYEHCPFVLVEAFACGTPVLASDRGAMPEMVTGNGAGGVFAAGDAGDLARAVREVWTDDDLLATWRGRARRSFEERYSPDRAYATLMEAFELAKVHADRR